MNMQRSIFRRYTVLLAVALYLSFPVVSGVAQTPVGSDRNRSPDRYVTINLNDVDINVFIKFISELTDTNFIVDDRVKGNVTIISPSRISINEAFRVFESVLEVNGFTTVPSGKVTKIVPAPDARTKDIKTLLKRNAQSPEDRVVTQIIPLTYADADQIKRLFTPLVSKNSVILSYPATNMLIVTDVQSNISRLIRILDAIDITGIGHEISVVPIIYSDAAKMAQLLETVFAPSRGKGQKGAAVKTLKFVPEERTNTIVMLASEVDTERARRLIAMLDKEVPEGKEKIHVYYLENAQSEDLAKVLQALPTKAPAGAPGKKAAPVVPESVKITADKATNSLIIMAEKDDYMVLEEVIRKLDIPRSMVFIESVIMEVNVEKDFSVGVEWAAFSEIGNQEGIFGTGFSGGDAGGQFANTGDFLNNATLPSGFSVGAFKDIISVTTPDGVKNFASLSAMVQAFSKDKDVHFLSTPQLLTTDNEEATIVVGKNVPFQTRSAAEAGIETYQSFEYRDVGITLKITPHVTQERMVQLDISEEISKVDELATTTPDRPTTLKRTIETSVIVADQNTVVIGGLIDDSFTETEYKVPFLGDIPLLGWLFKSRSTATEKSNLFIFLTPKVVANPSESAAILRDKQNYMDELRQGSIKLYEDNGRRTDAPARRPAEIPD
ncbi:General secretion pathway protein D [Olavius algarvensis associated proteobacterium Delta 3]|nr:General secretion pathway protein D [Olavius algarvensis associated proteobacterium Delta 3]